MAYILDMVATREINVLLSEALCDLHTGYDSDS